MQNLPRNSIFKTILEIDSEHHVFSIVSAKVGFHGDNQYQLEATRVTPGTRGHPFSTSNGAQGQFRNQKKEMPLNASEFLLT